MAQLRWSIGREFVLRAAASAPRPRHAVPLFRPFRAMREMPAHFRAGEFGPAVPTARHARSRWPSTCALQLLQCSTAPILPLWHLAGIAGATDGAQFLWPGAPRQRGLAERVPPSKSGENMKQPEAKSRSGAERPRVKHPGKSTRDPGCMGPKRLSATRFNPLRKASSLRPTPLMFLRLP
jgi:hypothetical protein